MFDDAPPPSAAERVAAAGRDTPGALALAALVPQAARIERRLLRALRLEVLPHWRAADEAELWASDLVELRALDGLVLRADVQELLRERARDDLQHRPRSRAAARLKQANELLKLHHANLPPLVQLEEEIGWLAMKEAVPSEAVQNPLNVALAALVRDGRVGVARWAARALPRLPGVAQRTRSAWQLGVASSNLLPAGQRIGLPTPAGVGIVDLRALAPRLGKVALGLRRIGDRLELGAVGPGGVALMVPASEPRFVTVHGAELDGPLEIAVPSGERVEFGVGWGAVELQAADGQRWSSPVVGDDEWRVVRGVSQVPERGESPDTLIRTIVGEHQAVTVSTEPDASGTRGGLVRRPLLDTGLRPQPLPLAEAVPLEARVVSIGLDGVRARQVVVGIWNDDEDAGPTVLARTRALPELCLGAPVVHEGRLAGVVTQAVPETAGRSSGEEGWVRLFVANRPQDLTEGFFREAPAGIGVELLPASNGAAVLIGWGPADARHHLLFDGGPQLTAKALTERLRSLARGGLDLVAVSHADADRVQGVTHLLEAGIRPEDLWFNGPDQLGLRHGVRGAHSVAVERLLAATGRLNAAFSGEAIVVPPQGPLPRIELAGGASITVLAPDDRALAALAPSWNRDATRRSMSKASSAVDEFPADEAPDEKPPRRPPKFGSDRGINNGASLVLLFECEGRSVLLPGDTHADTLVNALRRLATERGRSGIYVDVFVLPHGGSRGNITPELFDVLEAGTYAVSTDGSRFGHPDPETIDLIARRAQGATLAFNYRRKTTERWANETFLREHRLQVLFPDAPEGGITLELQVAVGQSAA